ncbi:MAG TPA: ATP-grasp domain-containing protein [Syntrophomonas sp.]|nr:ATP-grasp domain-containing protein [Syntrophomonas sp.]
MKLFEYQAKELFQQQGIAVPPSVLIENMDELGRALDQVGIPCVLKAQVLHGGRGKAGLVKFVTDADTARAEARRIMEATGKNLLVEAAVDFDQEVYLSLTVDPVTGAGMIMACTEGGMDIEDIARNTPEKIIREQFDIVSGLMPFQATDLMYTLGFSGPLIKEGSKLLMNLHQIFMDYDAELVEINPLMITKDGKFIAADGKVNIDDNSLYKHNRYTRTREYYANDIEYEAAADGIPYIQFDGDIGLMCAGAGLTNVIFDLIQYGGGTVANYLEFGGPNYRKAHKCLKMMLGTKPKVVLIATFGTIARADVMAQGIAEAVTELKTDIPIVTVIRGTGEEEAREILKNVGLTPLDDTEEAVAKAIELAGGAR